MNLFGSSKNGVFCTINCRTLEAGINGGRDGWCRDWPDGAWPATSGPWQARVNANLRVDATSRSRDVASWKLVMAINNSFMMWCWGHWRETNWCWEVNVCLWWIKDNCFFLGLGVLDYSCTLHQPDKQSSCF